MQYIQRLVRNEEHSGSKSLFFGLLALSLPTQVLLHWSMQGTTYYVPQFSIFVCTPCSGVQ
jgi:hypothetical protein